MNARRCRKSIEGYGRRRAAALVTVMALVAVLAAGPGEAQTTAPQDSATTLHLEERAERMVPRDRLRAVLRVDATGADPGKLQGEINRRMAAALDRARGAAGITVATGGYAVYQERPDPKAPPRWHGTQSLSLVGRDAAAVLALTGALQQDGLVIGALSYELSSEAARSVEDELTATALARLRERGARIAAALNLAVERLRDLRVGNATGTQPVPRAAMSAMKADAPMPLPVAEPGEATVSITVDADLVLAPSR